MGLMAVSGLLKETRLAKKEENWKWTRSFLANRANRISIEQYGDKGDQVTENWVLWLEVGRKYYCDADLRKALLVARALGISKEQILAVLF